MTTLIMSVALLFTIALCLAIGVISAYGAIIGILHAFNPHRDQKPRTPALVATAGPSGD
ncbi:MAG TPA: hypothetical protein VEG32_06060 [Clostridia bacterium]|nr:hypothetical protein [Clostridia bacterium]